MKTTDRAPESPPDAYERAGIDDREAFYLDKFVSDEVLDARYFRPLDRFDLRYARTMWVYDNVRRGTSLLDLGCGAGMLALLARKGVSLTGVDLSEHCVAAARRNGYDVAVRAPLVALPFEDASFDYVASLDVLGHVGDEEKDTVLAEIRRVLRAGGVTLHGIECTDRAVQRSYAEMSDDELRRFVAVDGHVGLAEEPEHAARFERCFRHVVWESRFGLCLSSEEFLKQADAYGARFEPDWLDYLRGLSFSERRAFDMAMGYVFAKVSDLGGHLPRSGFYMFLKASDAPLGSFYGEHRDRSDLLGAPAAGPRLCLDHHPQARFDEGWYAAERLPPVARWMRRRSRVVFPAPAVSGIELDLTTYMPDVAHRPLELQFLLDGRHLDTLRIDSVGWRRVSLRVPAGAPTRERREHELEIRADRTWQPRPWNPGRDDRELSVAVCNLEVRT